MVCGVVPEAIWIPEEDFTRNDAPEGSDAIDTPWLDPPPAIVAHADTAIVAAARIGSRRALNKGHLHGAIGKDSPWRVATARRVGITIVGQGRVFICQRFVRKREIENAAVACID